MISPVSSNSLVHMIDAPKNISMTTAPNPVADASPVVHAPIQSNTGCQNISTLFPSDSLTYKLLAPFINPSEYTLQPENFWIWEAGFLLFAALILAMARRYFTFLKRESNMVIQECLLWALDSFLIILGLALWRYLNGQHANWTFSFQIAILVGIFAGLFSFLLEICGLNSIIYSEEYPEPECSIGEDYCDGLESKNLLFIVSSLWILLFIYVVTAYFVLNSKGVFDKFKAHYYPKPVLANYSPSLFVGGFISVVSFIIIGFLSLVFLIVLTPIYCIYYLIVPTNKSISDFFQKWICMKDALFHKIPNYQILPNYFKKIDNEQNLQRAYSNGWIIFLWGFELVFFAAIFAAPIILTIHNRLQAEKAPKPISSSSGINKIYRNELIVLFFKYIFLIGLKMMLEVALSSKDIQHTSKFSI